MAWGADQCGGGGETSSVGVVGIGISASRAAEAKMAQSLASYLFQRIQDQYELVLQVASAPTGQM
jgi:hypothetical protein